MRINPVNPSDRNSKPKDWPEAFAQFVAKSHDNFRSIDLKLINNNKIPKLLGQTTFRGVELRAVLVNGNILVQGMPLQGTTHDFVEEFVAHGTEEMQGSKLSKKDQETLTYAVRDNIIDATEAVLEGLTPEYIAARLELAKRSPIRVVTSEQEMPEKVIPVEHFDDIRELRDQVNAAYKRKTPDPNREDEEILRIFGNSATLYRKRAG